MGLDSDKKDFVVTTVEEAVKMRSEGASDEEIVGRLGYAIKVIDDWAPNTEMVRKLILGSK